MPELESNTTNTIIMCGFDQNYILRFITKCHFNLSKEGTGLQNCVSSVLTYEIRS